MKKYKILDIANQDYSCSVMVSDSEKFSRKSDGRKIRGVKHAIKIIDLPKSAAEKLSAGQNIFVLQSKFSEDYVYMYPGGVCLRVKPVSDDKYSCRYYIKNLPGIFNGCKLDRFVFKAVLLCECKRRNIRSSLNARRNLQKLVARKGFEILER